MSGPEGSPIAGAIVQVSRDARAVASATTSVDGQYAISNIPEGTYTLVARRIGFAEFSAADVRIAAGTTRDITLATVPATLDRVVVSGSRAPEKILTAPASISLVDVQRIEERPSLTIADHLRAQPGVDVSKGGLVESNIVARGFNNAFSGAMLVLQDNRFAGVPSLRVNVPALFPSVNEDIEQIEVLLGPAAALYGPNSAAGVLHIITKSPFASTGGTLTVDAGTRSVIRTSGRYAALLGNKLAFKVSGEVRRDRIGNTAIAPNQTASSTGEIANGAGVRRYSKQGRDFDVAKSSGELRVDFRPTNGVEWINTAGFTQAGSFIDITGANGAAQVKDWDIRHCRVVCGGMAPSRRSSSIAAMLGTTTVSTLTARFRFLYGHADRRQVQSLVRTTPACDRHRNASEFHHRRRLYLHELDHGRTVNGRNEDIDDVTEAGGYIHSVTRFTPRWELVGALRYDQHSEMTEGFVSPRVALVFKPTPEQNVRLTYNRAFSMPAPFSFFLDLPQARIPVGSVGYTIRALGVPSSGFNYARGSAGLGGLYLRSRVSRTRGKSCGHTSVGAEHAPRRKCRVVLPHVGCGNQTAFVNALMAVECQPPMRQRSSGCFLAPLHRRRRRSAPCCGSSTPAV